MKKKEILIREREQGYLTQLHRKNHELEKKNCEYQEALNSKNRFFSIIAHDLRNPFQVVLGYTGLLLEHYDNMSVDDIKEYFSDIESATSELMSLLDNLLLWSRSETGAISMRPTTIDLHNLTESTLAIIKVNATEKDITLKSHILPKSLVVADKDMVLTILRNLMTNAVKFTPHGGTVSIEVIPIGTEMLQITVKDTGIGMSKEDINKLFKADTAYSHKGTSGEKGTGLGLVLCHEFVEKHRGTIWVESELGEGSSFNFTIPRHRD